MRRVLSTAVCALAVGCGARTTLATGADAGAAPDGGVGVDASDAGPTDGGIGDAGASDAGAPDARPPDAGPPPCTWPPGAHLGVWRELDAEGDERPAVFHVDADGRFGSATLWDEPGGAYGMGLAVRGEEVGVAWRVRSDEAPRRRLYFGRVRGGCLEGEPTVVEAREELQAFRGNLAATDAGWLVFWTAVEGIWARPLAPDGTPAADAALVGPGSSDARFALASRGDAVALVHAPGSPEPGLRLVELGPDGAPRRAVRLGDGDGLREPRVVPFGDGFAGVWAEGEGLTTFALGSGDDAPTVAPIDDVPVCARCFGIPAFAAPAVASDGRILRVLWPAARGDAVELRLSQVDPGVGARGPSTRVTDGPAARWPAMGVAGDGWLALYGTGEETRVLRPAADDPRVVARHATPRGVQRLPRLVRAP